MAISEMNAGSFKPQLPAERIHRVKASLTKPQFLTLRKIAAQRGVPMSQVLGQLLAPTLEILVDSHSQN